jgi:large repetitive protein
VTWSLAGAGALSNSTSSSTTYTAPNSVATASTATLTATSVANTTEAAVLTINLVAPPTVSTTSLPVGTVDNAYTATLVATGGIQPLSWSVTSGTLPNGLTLNASTGAISGTPTVNNTFAFTVQVQDAESVTATSALSITVNPAPLSVITTSLPFGNVGSTYPSPILKASGGVPPYAWSVVVGSLPPGLALDGTTGAISGTPATIGTSNFTVQVTDSLNATSNGALSITINPSSASCSSGSESKLNGQYAFQMQGFDANGPIALSGEFDADGLGHIATTVGVIDVNRSTGVQTNLPINSANSSYTVGSDNRRCLTIATSAGTSFFRISLGTFNSGVAGQGHLIEFDGSGTLAAGVIKQQDSSAFSDSQINGSYAFGISSSLSLTNSSRFGAVGSFLASGGSITGGAVDTNNSGNVDNSGSSNVPASPLTFTGTYSVSSNGRGTLTLNLGGTTLNAIIYVVSAQKLLIMSVDRQTTNPVFAGSILQQSGAPFSNSSLSTTTTSVLYSNGIISATPPTSDALVGIISVPSSGNLALTGDENNGTTTVSVASSGTYTVDSSSGRVVTTASGPNPLAIAYLVSANEGFLLGSDNRVMTGFFEPQAAGPFTNASGDGMYSYGSLAPTTSSIVYEAGVTSLSGGNLTGTVDTNSLHSGRLGNQGFADTYSIDSTGRGTDGNGDIFYVIDPSAKVVRLSVQPGDVVPVEATE